MGGNYCRISSTDLFHFSTDLIFISTDLNACFVCIDINNEGLMDDAMIEDSIKCLEDLKQDLQQVKLKISKDGKLVFTLKTALHLQFLS